MTCRSGCPTQDHRTYGECLKAANPGAVFGSGVQRRVDNELAAYRAARKAGIQPAGTTQHAIDMANHISDRYGLPYDATTGRVGGKYAVHGEAVDL